MKYAGFSSKVPSSQGLGCLLGPPCSLWMALLRVSVYLQGEPGRSASLVASAGRCLAQRAREC